MDSTEDMFAKLESMRAIITEVNTQFKDPVRASCKILKEKEKLFVVRSLKHISALQEKTKLVCVCISELL